MMALQSLPPTSRFTKSVDTPKGGSRRDAPGSCSGRMPPTFMPTSSKVDHFQSWKVSVRCWKVSIPSGAWPHRTPTLFLATIPLVLVRYPAALQDVRDIVRLDADPL